MVLGFDRVPLDCIGDFVVDIEDFVVDIGTGSIGIILGIYLRSVNMMITD